MSTPNATGVNT